MSTPSQLSLLGQKAAPAPRKVRVSAHERTIAGSPAKPSERAKKTVSRSTAGITETSREAYRHATETTASSLREIVYRFIADRGAHGATDQEIQAGISLHEQTQGPRRNELVKLGKVVNSGKRRPTRSGRSAIVWIAVDA